MVELTDAELDENGPERTCIVTRAKGTPDQMIRFVAAPDGTVTPDLKKRLPGRGVWVTATAKAVAEAVKKGSFARGLRAKVIVSPALAQEVAKTHGSVVGADAAAIKQNQPTLHSLSGLQSHTLDGEESGQRRCSVVNFTASTPRDR